MRREAAPAPIASTLYYLTARGEGLRPVLKALGAWGAPLLALASDDDAFLGHWLTMPAEVLLHDRSPDGPAVTIELRASGEPVTIEASGGEIRAVRGAAKAPDAVVSGRHRAIVRLMAGRLNTDSAAEAGLRLEGDIGALRRLLP